jgi:hypothetical protein
VAIKRKVRRMVRSGAHEAWVVGVDMLNQLLPHKIVRDARDLMVKLQRDDAFRDYVASRIWRVIPVVFVFFLVSAVCAVGVMLATARLIPAPAPFWLRVASFFAGVVTLVVGLGAQTYVFFVWLEERAAHRSRAERGIQVQVPSGFFAYLKYSRALAAWILIGIFVAVPLAGLAVRAPMIALALVCLVVLPPALFKKLDS